MKKTVLLFTVFFSLLSSIAYSQETNTVTSRDSYNVCLIKMWIHNPELKLDNHKLLEAKQDIKNKMLLNSHFIIHTPLDENQDIIVLSGDNTNLGGLIQKIYSEYQIKINVMEIREVQASDFDFSNLPISSTQTEANYKIQLLEWENENTPTLNQLQSLFQ